MSDVALIVYGTCAAVILAFVSYVWLVLRRPEAEASSQGSSGRAGTAAAARAVDNDENVMRIGNRVIRSRHGRVAAAGRKRDTTASQQQQPPTPPDSPQPAGRATANQQDSSSSDQEDIASDSEADDDANAPELPRETAMPEGKIGKMKRLKLEMKAEKRMMRENELLAREERRKRQEAEDEVRRKKEEEQEQREREREEAERKAKEEKERREYEEYLKIKQSFQVQEDGYDANVDECDAQNKLIEFIESIRSRKIVLLEELAAEFKMKTQEVIDRIQSLLESGQLTGVIDDRGKFIYITEDELRAVAKFIRQRGRVSIVDLVENSNQLIKL